MPCRPRGVALRQAAGLPSGVWGARRASGGAPGGRGRSRPRGDLRPPRARGVRCGAARSGREGIH